MIKYDIAQNLKYYGYQRGLTSLVYKFTDKKTVKNDKNYQKNYANQLFENLIKNCTHIL